MSGDAPPSPLAVAGHPLHTRTLVVDVARAGTGLRAAGEILDLRKCGFVPTGGDLQTAGFVHHMKIDLEVDATSRAVTRLEAAQPHLAFRPCAATDGTSCSDPVPRLQALVGAPVDADFQKRLSRGFGGPLGCSHLLTLAQLMGSVLPRALDAEAELARREDGERVWKSALVLDGAEGPDGALGLFVQSHEFQTTPRARVESPVGLLARQSEVRVSARIDLDAMRVASLEAAERTRTPGDLDAAWRSRTPELADRVGEPAMGGLAAVLLARFGPVPTDRPLLDALLNLAPGAIQCLAAMTDRMLAALERGASSESARAQLRAVGVGGMPDSCYMWRSGGPLERQRRPHLEEE